MLIIIAALLMKSVGTINCSEPTSDAFLAALKDNIFYKTDVRPVYYQTTPINISMSFTLYGILGVVSLFNISDKQTWKLAQKGKPHILELGPRVYKS